MKNRNILTFSVAWMLFPILFLSVIVIGAQAATEKPVIVCTTSAIGSVVETCLGETADVLVLVQPGLCPADFDMKPGYVDAVSNAQILFKQNIEGEFSLDGLLEAAGNPDLTVVAIPGVYNTPEGAKNYIREVGGNLSQILGINLDSKISEMLNEIDAVSIWITSQAGMLQVSNVKVICMAWLRTFIESAGFNVVATYNPPETLSAGDITALLETARTEDVALIVDNLQIDTEFGEGIGSQLGAEHLVLTNFPGAIPKTETLSTMLRYNAEQLFNGTVTWQSSSTIRAEREDLVNQVTIYQITTSLALIIVAIEAILLYVERKRNK